MKHVFLIAVFFLFLPLITHSQIATVSDAVSVRTEDDIHVLGKLDNKFFITKENSNSSKIICFDEYMKIDWENEISTEKKAFDYIGNILTKEFYGVILQYRKKGDYYVQFQKFDSNGSIIDSVNILNYGNRLFSPKSIIVRSADQKKIAILNDREDNVMEACVFDTEKMEVLWQESIVANDLSVRNELYQIILDKSGTLHMAFYKHYAKANRQKNRFVFYQLGEYKKVTNLNFQNNILYDVTFEYDEKTNRLIGAGLYDSKKNGRTNGYFMISIPKNGKEEIVFGQFDKKIITTLRGKESEIGDSFSEAYAKEIVLKSNGGIVLVVERYKMVSHGTTGNTTRPGIERSELYTPRAEYHFDDILLLNLDKKGESEWQEILYKRQFSRDDEGKLSSFHIIKNQDNLEFIYNDEIKSLDNNISSYTLYRDGMNKRNSLMDTEGQNISLMFSKSIQTGLKEILIPSIRRKELKLVRIKFGADPE